MVWSVYCKVGVYWDGPLYFVGTYRSQWYANLRAKFHLYRYPYRQCIIVPTQDDEWHFTWKRNTLVERRFLQSWFCEHDYYRDRNPEVIDSTGLVVGKPEWII